MALSKDTIERYADRCTPNTETGSLNYRTFARAIEAEVHTQDEALIRQLVAALESYRLKHNDTHLCDAERAAHAWLEGK